MKNFIIFISIFILLMSCKDENKLHICPINDSFNQNFKYHRKYDHNRGDGIQYFYIKNYNKIPIEQLAEEIFLFSYNQIDSNFFKNQSQVNYFYKKKFLKY